MTIVITPPSVSLLTRDEAKQFARIDGDDENELIDTLVWGASRRLDGPSGLMRRALITQVLEIRLDTFPSGTNEIPLPAPPLITLDSVKYIDVGGVEQTLSTSVYTTIGGSPNISSVILAYGQSWPYPQIRSEAVRLRFTAGYGPAAANVPEPIRLAARILVAHWFDNRDKMGEVPGEVTGLISQYVVPAWSVG